MPISFGTSTTLISLPALLGGFVGWPPSYFTGAAGAGAPAPHSSGLVGKSSPPSHLLAAFAPVAHAASAIAAAVVRRYLAFIMASFPASPPQAANFAICQSRRRFINDTASTE